MIRLYIVVFWMKNGFRYYFFTILFLVLKNAIFDKHVGNFFLSVAMLFNDIYHEKLLIHSFPVDIRYYM